MADVKISALPATTTPLDGDELVPVVDDPAGIPATEQVTVEDLLGDTGNVLGGSADDETSVVVGATASSVNAGSSDAPNNVVIGPGTAVNQGSTISQHSNVFIGRNITGGGQSNVAIGNGADVGSSQNNVDRIAIGKGATVTGHGGVAIGAGAIAGGTAAVALGQDVSAGLREIRIGTTTQAHDVVIGGSSFKVNGNVGFYGTTPVAKPSVDADTVDSVVAALVALGLVSDARV